ncbi:MAG: hypothetical protein H6713_01820 [Myxococcales bacterium]|nr:hypothetical protein [Myxococcales bacterium]
MTLRDDWYGYRRALSQTRAMERLLRRHGVRPPAAWSRPHTTWLAARLDRHAAEARTRALRRALLESLAADIPRAASRVDDELARLLEGVVRSAEDPRELELAATLLAGVLPELPIEVAPTYLRSLAARDEPRANRVALALLSRPDHPMWPHAFEHVVTRYHGGELLPLVLPLITSGALELTARVLERLLAWRARLPPALIRRLLIDPRAEFRRLALGLAREIELQFTWPEVLLLALVDDRATTSQLVEETDHRGFRWDAPVPPEVTVRTCSHAHRVAFSITITPGPLRRALIELLRGGPGPEAPALAEQLHRAELAHQRHLLTRALLARDNPQARAPRTRTPSTEHGKFYENSIRALRELAERYGITLAEQPPSDAGYQRARRLLLRALPRVIVASADDPARELADLLAYEVRGPERALAGELLYLVYRSVRGYAAESCLVMLVRNQLPQATAAMRGAFARSDALGLVALREGEIHLPRARVEPLARALLDHANPELLRAALLVLDHYGAPVDEDRLVRFAAHEDRLVRRYTGRIAARVNLVIPWPDSLIPALLGDQPSSQFLYTYARVHGLGSGARLPLAITAAPFSAEHAAALVVLRERFDVRQALTRRLLQHPTPAVQALGEQLARAELEHRRQLLLRALLHRAAAEADDVVTSSPKPSPKPSPEPSQASPSRPAR